MSRIPVISGIIINKKSEENTGINDKKKGCYYLGNAREGYFTGISKSLVEARMSPTIVLLLIVEA